MTDTQQPTNPARPTPLPQRQNGPQTVRIPVTSLVNPQARRPIAKGVPAEEAPDEPWQEKEFDPEDTGEQAAPAPKADSAEPDERGEPVQLPRRPTFARAGERNERSASRPELPTPRPGLPIRTRGDAAPSTEYRPSAAAAPGAPAASGSGRPALPRLGSNNSSNAPAASGSGRPVLPRMELKPVLPVDPERSGVNVIPVPARVLAPPPPASLSGGQPETAAPVRFSPPTLARSPDFAPGAPLGGAPTPAPAPETDSATTPGAFTSANALTPAPELSAVLEHLVNLPDQTAILGVCDDHLPVLLDLGDPTPGALLVASDDETLRERMMRTLLQTAAALNSPRSVQFLILSTHPADWQAWLDGLDAVRHCLGVDSLVEGSPARWLLKLAGWADQRRTGSSSGPAVILVVDDLAAVSQLEYDARVNFDWLVKEGPGVRIWPVVGLAVERAPELARWVRLFKTRILGPARDASLYRQLAALDAQESATLLQPAQFAVRIQENWLKFRVPTLPGEKG